MNLNPFDLNGPAFLLFYAILTAIVAVMVRKLGQQAEAGRPSEDLNQARDVARDPYEIAFLRAGRSEAVRVAMVSLIERGLLRIDGKKLGAAPDAVGKVQHPLDKAILTRFAGSPEDSGISASVAYANPAIMAEADLLGETLQKRKLLPDETVRQGRMMRNILAVGFLWVIAGTKIVVALSRGRTNIGFLLILAFITPVLIWAVSRRTRTVLGDRTQGRLQEMFSSLKARRDSLVPYSTDSELTYLAAAYSMSDLPGSFTSMVAPLEMEPPKPQPASRGGNDAGSSCAVTSGSSCSSGSSCGSSSCGGGGGCGGCGS